MSVLIKGMEMPKSCDDCKLRNGMGKDDGKAIYHCAPLAKWVVPNPLGRADLTTDCPLVEVVRCKDCKFLEMGQNESDSWRYCRMTKGNVADSDFCSYGERRINDIL